MIDEKRSFFCSELVAKAFKVLGVIENDDTNCASYFPHHFSAVGDKNLKFTKGTKVQEEQSIIVEDFMDQIEEEKPRIDSMFGMG